MCQHADHNGVMPYLAICLSDQSHCGIVFDRTYHHTFPPANMGIIQVFWAPS